MLNLKNNRTPYRKTNVKTLYKPAFIANEVHLAAPSFIGNNLGIYTRPLCAVYLAKSPLIFLGVSIFLHVEQQIIYKIHKTQLCTYNIYKVQKRKAHNTHRKRRSLTRRRMEVHINLRANKINKRRVFGDSPVENGSEREGALGGKHRICRHRKRQRQRLFPFIQADQLQLQLWLPFPAFLHACINRANF